MFIVAYIDNGDSCDGFPRVLNKKFTNEADAHDYVASDYKECYKDLVENDDGRLELVWEDNEKATVYIDGDEVCSYNICCIDD